MKLSDVHQTTPSQVDEALKDYLSLVGNALAGVVSSRRHGRAEVLALTLDNKRSFMKYLGRAQHHTFDTVRWGTLFQFMTLKDGLELTPDEVTKIFRDPSTKTKISELWNKQKSSEPGNKTLASKEALDTWAQKNSPIGGPESPDSGKRAEIAVTYILELGSIKRLEKEAGAQEMPDEEPKTQPPTKEVPQEKPAEVIPSPAPGTTTSPKLDPATIANIKQQLATLKGI